MKIKTKRAHKHAVSSVLRFFRKKVIVETKPFHQVYHLSRRFSQNKNGEHVKPFRFSPNNVTVRKERSTFYRANNVHQNQVILSFQDSQRGKVRASAVTVKTTPQRCIVRIKSSHLRARMRIFIQRCQRNLDYLTRSFMYRLRSKVLFCSQLIPKYSVYEIMGISQDRKESKCKNMVVKKPKNKETMV